MDAEVLGLFRERFFWHFVSLMFWSEHNLGRLPPFDRSERSSELLAVQHAPLSDSPFAAFFLEYLGPVHRPRKGNGRPEGQPPLF